MTFVPRKANARKANAYKADERKTASDRSRQLIPVLLLGLLVLNGIMRVFVETYQ
jgi:hypothetical protein